MTTESTQGITVEAMTKCGDTDVTYKVPIDLETFERHHVGDGVTLEAYTAAIADGMARSGLFSEVRIISTKEVRSMEEEVVDVPVASER